MMSLWLVTLQNKSGLLSEKPLPLMWQTHLVAQLLRASQIEAIHTLRHHRKVRILFLNSNLAKGTLERLVDGQEFESIR